MEASYEKNSYSNLSIVKITSYVLCTLISISNIVKDNWRKELEEKNPLLTLVMFP